GGMRALPTSAWLPAAPPQASPAGPQAPPPAPAAWRQLSGTVRHGFTHFELHLTVAVAAPASRPETPLDPSGIWLPVADIAAAGLPTVFAKAARHVLANRNAHAPDGLCRFESA
ncbi:MAG: NUDIX domain-containing protein, partial [Polymorphobacter sp.]